MPTFQTPCHPTNGNWLQLPQQAILWPMHAAMAESQNQIPREIGGSQNGHQAIDCAINRVLTLDAFQQKRISGAVTSMDADTCYDCMAHSMISLCSQCLALVVEVITSLLLTIQLMKFFLWTAFGDSTHFYGGQQPIPLQGCCQGNGGGPVMWVSVLIILAHQLWANGHVTTFVWAISGLKVSFAGFLYVDDGDLATAACTPTESEASMVNQAQKGTSCWQGGLRASGGDAKFEKTFWTLICFIWLNGNWRYKTKDETISKLYMLGPNNKQLKIMKLDPSEPVKAVGITQLADGCMASQLEEMLSKIEDFGTAFHDGWVPRRYVWLGLQSTIWLLLSYPLVACSFLKAEADCLTLALYKLILLTLGASKSLPNVYHFAPLSLQGLEAPNFYVEQGICKVSKLLTHGDSGNLTSDLIAMSMEQAQLEVSIGTPPTLPANGTTLPLPGASTNHSLVATTDMLHEWMTAMLASSSGNTLLHHSLPIPASLPHISTGGAMPS